MTPRLIDEWQIEPTIWNYTRRAVDDRGAPGQFILTGSAVPTDDITRHTGAARLTRLRMRPMSLFEAERSTGAISLSELLAGVPVQSPDPRLTIRYLTEQVVIGGWPANLSRPAPQSVAGRVTTIRSSPPSGRSAPARRATWVDPMVAFRGE
jgi:hypothetical protein